MKHPIKDLKNADVGEIELTEAVFGLEPRVDIMSRMVNYQLAKRRAGTHKVLRRSEVSGSRIKAFRQKGTGRARRGDGKVTQFRGGATMHGPVVRSHAHSLPKKIRRLALRSALSAKLQQGKLIIVDELKLDAPKTKDFNETLKILNLTSALFVGGQELDMNLAKAASNVPNIDVLPSQGANVYDILRRDTLVLAREAVETLEARLK